MTSIPYPKVGEENSAARIGIVPVDGDETVWVRLPGVSKDMYVPRMDWADNSEQLIIQQLNRNDGITAIDDLPTTTDTDFDGIADTTDNCPDDQNGGQENTDGDALGDACDAFPDDAYNNAPPPSAAITITLPDGRRVTGTVFTFRAEGFKLFSLVQAFIQSDPIFVGEEMADKDGKVTFNIVLPLELPLGDHTLLLLGQNYDGTERELTDALKIELSENILSDSFE